MPARLPAVVARACCLVALLSAGLAARGAAAGDWPQILGPTRNGIAADDERIAARFPAGGPRVLWQREVGQGFAGPAVVGDRVVLFHRVGDEEIAECMDRKTGDVDWKAAFPTQFQSAYSSDHGPRCVPLVHRGRVYMLGAGGNLHCVALESGKKLWSRAAYREFGAPEGYFGAGSSPIVAGGKLLLNVGSRSGAGLVAFDLESGKTLWQATNELASYSSPVEATIGGVHQVVFVTRYNAMAVSAADGKVFWRFPFGKRGPTVNGASPLVLGDHVFLSAAYGIGAAYVRVAGGEAKADWENDASMSSQYCTCVHKDGTLYGIDGRDDVGGARLRALDPKTGRVLWTREDTGMGTVILADGKLIVMTTDGELLLAAPSPQAYRQLASAQIFNTKAYALPALSGGLLYVRDRGEMKCLDLRP